MCMIDDCEPCIWLGTKTRVARKDHKCDECGRAIHGGEKYDYSKYVSDGYLITNKACAHCAVARTWLKAHCGGWVTEALKEELEEHWSERYRVDRLGRLLVGIRNQWSHLRKPGLMPLPIPLR